MAFNMMSGLMNVTQSSRRGRKPAPSQGFTFGGSSDTGKDNDRVTTAVEPTGVVFTPPSETPATASAGLLGMLEQVRGGGNPKGGGLTFGGGSVVNDSPAPTPSPVQTPSTYVAPTNTTFNTAAAGNRAAVQEYNAVQYEAAAYEAEQLGDPVAAEASLADAIVRDIEDDELSAVQLEKMLASGSPLMVRAAARGMDLAASRGLLNSSIAAGTSQAAMIDAATPFALQDSRTYNQQALENQRAQNAASLANSQTQTNVNLFNTGEQNQNARLNVAATNTAAANNAAARNNASQFNAASVNSASQFNAGAQNTASLQSNQFNFQAAENAANRQNQLEQIAAQGANSMALAQYNNSAQVAYLGMQQTFSAAQAELDREANAESQANQNAFNQYMQDDQQGFLENQNALDREFQEANIDQQSATTIALGAQQAVGAVYADPNLTAAQKAQAVANIYNQSIDMPDLINNIQNPGSGNSNSGSGDVAYDGNQYTAPNTSPGNPGGTPNRGGGGPNPANNAVIAQSPPQPSYTPPASTGGGFTFGGGSSVGGGSSSGGGRSSTAVQPTGVVFNPVPNSASAASTRFSGLSRGLVRGRAR
jgi:hypothetical protein